MKPESKCEKKLGLFTKATTKEELLILKEQLEKFRKNDEVDWRSAKNVLKEVGEKIMDLELLKSTLLGKQISTY